MKTLTSILLLFTVTNFTTERSLRITLNLLPELREEFKTQPIRIQISYNNYKIEKIDTTITNQNIIHFKNIRDQVVYVFISASINCKDSTTQKYYRPGRKVIYGNSRIEEQVITFPQDCSINKYLGGKICPICHKTDQSIPIIWGLPSFDLKGEPGIDYDLAGCTRTGCDPDWFCRRDSSRF